MKTNLKPFDWKRPKSPSLCPRCGLGEFYLGHKQVAIDKLGDLAFACSSPREKCIFQYEGNGIFWTALPKEGNIDERKEDGTFLSQIRVRWYFQHDPQICVVDTFLYDKNDALAHQRTSNIPIVPLNTSLNKIKQLLLLT
jgi:hypothetical protein